MQQLENDFDSITGVHAWNYAKNSFLIDIFTARTGAPWLYTMLSRYICMY